MFQLSILDQSIAAAGRPQGEAIRNTIALARHCEALGYHRFWLSEHHNHPTIMGTAPEILIAAIAATTKRIRIGSAGVMLPHYSAYKVAEQFRVLDAIAPGRIDLGLGRAPGSDQQTAFALNPLANEAPAHFPGDVRDLLAWLSDQPLVDGHPFQNLGAYPKGETVPEMWLLGSSNYGAEIAAHFGLPYCFAWFFSDGRGAAEALTIYRRNYQPSERHPTPLSSICIWALAADSHDEAQHHLSSRILWRVLRDRGQYTAMQPADVAAAHEYSVADAARAKHYRAGAFAGTKEEVAAQISNLAKELDVQEVAIVTWTHDEAIRHRSYELLAEHYGLTAEID